MPPPRPCCCSLVPSGEVSSRYMPNTLTSTTFSILISTPMPPSWNPGASGFPASLPRSRVNQTPPSNVPTSSRMPPEIEMYVAPCWYASPISCTSSTNVDRCSSAPPGKTMFPVGLPRSHPTSTRAASNGRPSSVLTFTAPAAPAPSPGFSLITIVVRPRSAAPGSGELRMTSCSETPALRPVKSTVIFHRSRCSNGMCDPAGVCRKPTWSTSPSMRPTESSKLPWSGSPPSAQATPPSIVRPVHQSAPCSGVTKNS